MPTKRISFSNFSRRLAISGGREQQGPSALRRASGIAPELTPSIVSRWGSQQLYGGINAIQLYYWNGKRYAYDGAKLYQNGTPIVTGFNGGRLVFNSMPPQVGLQDYLFVLGGGLNPFKISPTGTISNWGIQPPNNGASGANLSPDQIVIDNFNASAANWSHTNVAISNASIFPVGSGSLEINPSGAWNIVNDFSSVAQNWNYYTSGDFSLPTDVFQFWLYFDWSTSTLPTNFATWIELDIDVNDGSFTKDWYSLSIGAIFAGSTNPVVHHNINTTIAFQFQQWQQVTLPKDTFIRNGIDYQFDWSCVQAVRFKGANFGGLAYLGNFTLSGGCAMGAGPAVGNGGSEYDYYVVYRNLTTGSQSNPQDSPFKVFGVQDNKVQLSNIPLSPDSQVGARDIYRTQALTEPGGGDAFYLDTIYDNTTTTYIDDFSDESYQLVTTPWQKGVVVPPANHASGASYFVDAGNGYYFKLTTNGTTGSSPPQWTVPGAVWAAAAAFVINDTTAPIQAAGNFFKCTTPGTSGSVEPNWASALTTGDTITDGTVIWTNIGPQTTTDNTAVWTFQGINSTNVLSDTGLLFDNAAPTTTYGDAYGPFQGSMFWDRDSAAGAAGYVYASPPGRPEGVGQIYQVASTNDPTQKIIGWDGALWLLTEAQAMQLTGTYPQIAPSTINGANGTLSPFTVQSLQEIGIIYWAPDGIRQLNWAGSRLIGFVELPPLLRGQNEEDYKAWSALNPPIWAGLLRDEIVFSDNSALCLALSYDGLSGGELAWRLPGPILTAAYYEPQTGFVQAAFGGTIYLFEQPNQLEDGSTAIAFEMQSAGDFPDPGAQFTTQRIYITANLSKNGGSQTLIPEAIIDGTAYQLPAITGTGRQTFELSPKLCGRFFDGVRLTGSLSGRVEIYRIDADVFLGDMPS